MDYQQRKQMERKRAEDFIASINAMQDPAIMYKVSHPITDLKDMMNQSVARYGRDHVAFKQRFVKGEPVKRIVLTDEEKITDIPETTKTPVESKFTKTRKYGNSFNDVTSKDWFYDAVSNAYEYGQGYNDGCGGCYARSKNAQHAERRRRS